MNQYEAALNRLKEERLAVRDIREAILADDALKASDPAHRRQLLSQTLLELGQLARAIDVLTRLETGELVEMDAPAPVFAIPEIPRQTALIRKFQLPRGAVIG
ncbi:hypothetical protein [Brevundimonas sp. DC300-4]|uniref:hypothetical protein n=1 Tax=Brevundimonas sp. DC300-4 TaxID=2804594 RepID=UPI003CF9F33A